MSEKTDKILMGCLLLILIFSFQNCSSSQTLDSDSLSANSTKVSEIFRFGGGGEGYDGKISYINRSEANCPDGNYIRNKVDMNGESGQITRRDCSEIKPVSVSKEDLSLMPHNQGNAVLDKQVYDLLTTVTDPNSGGDSLSSKYLCRGKYENKNNKQMQVADVIVRYKQDGKIVHSALVIMAVYSPEKQLIETLNSGELELKQIETGVEGRLKYVSSIVNRHGITLWIDKNGENRTGKLSFIDLPYPGRQNEKGYNYRDYERVIQDLNCFAQ